MCVTHLWLPRPLPPGIARAEHPLQASTVLDDLPLVVDFASIEVMQFAAAEHLKDCPSSAGLVRAFMCPCEDNKSVEYRCPGCLEVIYVHACYFPCEHVMARLEAMYT